MPNESNVTPSTHHAGCAIREGLGDDCTCGAHFAPGSFGCHEAMHMAMVCAELVDERLCEHPALSGHPEWKALANRARRALHDLYQAIGREHMA